MEVSMNKPEYIVVHHSLTKDGNVVDTNAIIDYHERVLGWKSRSGKSGGYHGYIEVAGGELKYFRGRGEDEDGAHCKEFGMNHKSLGVCVVGNFDLTPPPIQTLFFLRDLCFAWMVNYGIPASRVLGHRDVGLMAGFDWRKKGPTGIREFKTCPGSLFPMESLFSMVAGKIDTEGVVR